MSGILGLLASGPARAQQPDTLAQTYTDARLGLRLALPASFQATPHPLGPPEPELTARLGQLAGPAAAAGASVLAVIRQQNAPRSTLTVVHLPTGAALAWLGWGFEAWRPGRYYRGSSSPPLTQELACALPAGGWLYLRAEVERAAYGGGLGQYPNLQRTLDILYGSRIFPALELPGTPPLPDVAALARYADSLVRHAPGGNPQPALATLQEGRHAAGANQITPAEYAADSSLSRYQHRYRTIAYRTTLALANGLDKYESFVNAPAQRWLRSESDLDFISLPQPQYSTDGTFGCMADEIYSVHEAHSDILRQTKGKQVALFDENVHRPHHRTLVAQLLPELYAQGFRYLLVSTLNGAAPLLGQQPYPAVSRHEFAAEYQFANLIRTARQQGFTLVGYADTIQPAGIDHVIRHTSDFGAERRQNEHLQRQQQNLRRALEQLPKHARVVLFTSMSEGNWDNRESWRDVRRRLLAGWGGKSVVVVNQSHTEHDQCIPYKELHLPPHWQHLDSLAAPGLARSIYKQLLYPEKPTRRPPEALLSTADITVYNRLDARRLPLPYPAATNARPVTLDLAPYRATSATGRRVLQLYLLEELSGPHPDQVPPVFTSEIGPQAGPLTLQLCPGRYRYFIRATAPLAEVQADITVPE
ncbi:hypothetical protein [Hymenobacter rubripertinctus]|uniref:Uncharacterized protein n=1 Tax=Hymenobacter rubripertinctus TaxID=2029981 RepID=A0A418QSD0_9BACT|nr:hypothetical protein [Hymenobacter rubripertinctus]RIY07930.1 hypothetical protein D0T11_15265 [Hymenobacter rubripertinctus]